MGEAKRRTKLGASRSGPMPKMADPVSPQELAYAHGVAGAAAFLKGPTENPEGYGLTIEFDDGEANHISFTDIPANRAMFAIKKEFGGGAKFYALSSRVYALQAVILDARFQQYCKPAADHADMIEVNDAIFEVAAMIPLPVMGDFDLDAFFAEVAKVAAKAPAGA